VLYITWRVERAAIALLRSMNDRELKDMGLTRGDIAAAVRGEGAWHRASPYHSLHNRP
jgi:uncharacterized protein YjiS (DUF1127 family)